MRAVVDPRPARLDELAGRDHRRVTKNRDQVALPASFDTQDAETVLFVVEGDALDQTGQYLGRRACARYLRHGRMMKFNTRKSYSIKQLWSSSSRRVSTTLRQNRGRSKSSCRTLPADGMWGHVRGCKSTPVVGRLT
jgi:hypothetical protein